MIKTKISNIDTKKLKSFFNDSILNGDQTLDITKNKLYCKASNVSMSSIIYREIVFDDKVVFGNNFPEHIKFFIQDYKVLYNVVNSMSNENEITLNFTYDGDLCKEIVLENSIINFSINCSEFALAKYIDDSKFNGIKYPTDIVSIIPIKSSNISEIKSLHKLSKSENEKSNLVFLYQEIDGLIMEHQSIRGGWKMQFKSNNIINDVEKYALSLDIFDNLSSGSDFELKLANLGSGKACYLTSNINDEMINISRIEKKNIND